MDVFQTWNPASGVGAMCNEISLDPEKSENSTNLPMTHTYASTTKSLQARKLLH